MNSPLPTRAEEARKYEYDPIENLRGKLDAASAEVKRATCERDAARTEAAMYERRAQERLWRQHDAEARAARAEAEVARLELRDQQMGYRVEVAEAITEALRERVAVLEGALKPFAKLGALFGPRTSENFDVLIYGPAAGPEYNLTGDHLRAAVRALHGGDQ